MKRFFILLAFLPINAEAQNLGCYIDAGTLNAYGATFLCNESVAHPALDTCGFNFAGDVAAFGGSLAESCKDNRAEIDDLRNQVGYYFANWSACGDTNNQIRGAIGFWEGLTHYYEGLTGRLRAKCGKKCRGVN